MNPIRYIGTMYGGPHQDNYHLSDAEKQQRAFEFYGFLQKKRGGQRFRNVSDMMEKLDKSKKFMYHEGHRGPGIYAKGVNALPSLEALQRYYVPHSAMANDAYRSIVVFKGKSLGDNIHKDGKIIQPREILKKYIFDFGDAYRETKGEYAGFMDASLHGIDKPTTKIYYELQDLMAPILKKQVLLDQYHTEKAEYVQNLIALIDGENTDITVPRTEASIREMMASPDFQELNRTSKHRLNALYDQIKSQHDMSTNAMVEVEEKLNHILNPPSTPIDSPVLQPGSMIYEKLKELDVKRIKENKSPSYFFSEWIEGNWDEILQDPDFQKLEIDLAGRKGSAQHDLIMHVKNRTNDYRVYEDLIQPPPTIDANTWNYQHGKIRALLSSVYDDFYENVKVGTKYKDVDMLLKRFPVEPDNMELVRGYLDNLQVQDNVDVTDLDALFDEINRITGNEIVADSGVRGATATEVPGQMRDPETDTVFNDHPSGVYMPDDADTYIERTNSMSWSGNDFSDSEWDEIERVRRSLSDDEYRSMREFMGDDELQNAVLHYYADDIIDELTKESLISQIDSEIPISGDKRMQLIQELKVKMEPFLTQSKKERNYGCPSSRESANAWHASVD